MNVNRNELRALSRAAGLSAAAVHVVPLTPSAPAVVLDDGAAIYPASMIKTPIAVAAAVAVAAGRLRWDELVEVGAADMTVNDAPSPLGVGVRAPVAELVELMLCRSDNVATNVLIERLGRERATADVVELGFTGTAIRRKLSGALPLIDDPAATGRNAHPAGEAADLFSRIAAGTIPGAGRIAGLLAAQYWNSKLTAGLAAADRFAHKTGDTDEVSHDGGILTLASGERFVLVVYTPLPSNEQTDARFATFMRALRPLLVAA